MPFQSQVYPFQAPAVAGDFADHNPRFSVMAGPGGLVAGVGGVTVGRFGWIFASQIDFDNAPAILNSFGSGAVAGIVGRGNFQGLNTTYLLDSSQNIPQGFPVTAFSGGAFWVKNEGSTQALVGQFAYAAFATGAVSFAAAGAASTAVVTGSIAASTASVTGSIANNVLTVTAVTSGTLVPGAIITGTGIATNTAIVSQLTGTIGGIGTYSVSIPEQTVASTTVSATYGTMTVTAVTSGVLGVGDSLTGAGVSTGTIITALGTGSGGLGTYLVNLTQTAASTTITAALTVQTKWIAMSVGNPGELVKITDHALG